jgi:hypothetical protein
MSIDFVADPLPKAYVIGLAGPFSAAVAYEPS